MKSPNPSPQKRSGSSLWTLALGAGLLASNPDQACARLTYDVRAARVDSPYGTIFDPKLVTMGLRSQITFEIWVQITSASGIGVFGYQNSAFSILSSNGGSLLGDVGYFIPIAPWNVAASSGTITASLDGDSDFDNGSNATNSIARLPKARSDNTPTGGGDPAFSYAQTTAVHVPSANFQPVTVGAESGYEFEIGTFTFLVTDFGPGNFLVPIGINVRPASAVLTSPGVKATSASFVEGGVAKSGLTGVFGVGADVMICPPVLDYPCTPEPSTFLMALLGATGLAAMRRPGMRCDSVAGVAASRIVSRKRFTSVAGAGYLLERSP